MFTVAKGPALKYKCRCQKWPGVYCSYTVSVVQAAPCFTEVIIGALCFIRVGDKKHGKMLTSVYSVACQIKKYENI